MKIAEIILYSVYALYVCDFSPGEKVKTKSVIDLVGV